jgi:LysR family positive regulator for ilvC
VEIRLHTGDPEDAINRVLAGNEDLAIGARPERLPAGLAFRPITESPMVFIAARSSFQQLPDAGSTDPAEAWSRTPMIVPERGVGRHRIDDWFRNLGATPSIYAQVAGNEAIVSMVSLGFGVGVVPRIVLDNSPLASTVRILDVQPGLAPYEVGLFALERRLASPLIRAFWSHQGE